MKPYLAILSARSRTLLQYRSAAIAGIVCQFFWGLIRIAGFAAFYRSTTSPQPMSFPQVVTYIWLSQAFMRMVPIGIDSEIRSMVNNGSIVYELTRPLDLYGFWFMRSIASLTAPVFIRCIPIFLIAGLFFGLHAPPSFEALLAFLLSLACAVILSAAIQTLLTISLLWTISGEGVIRITNVAVWIFSGLTIPLSFFPDWLLPVVNILPFRGLMDLPFRLYIGHLQISDLYHVLMTQIVWILSLFIIGRGILSMGLRRLVVQGG